MIKFFRSTSLLCFSPPVMIATVAIEAGLAAWILARYITSTTRNLAVAVLICLAGFQLAEFNVCGGHGSTLLWSRLGYVLITLLPPLGLHLILKLQKKRRSLMVWPAYAGAGVFIAAFAFVPPVVNGSVCTGNYVIFNIMQPLNTYYVAYYMAVLVIGLLSAARGASHSTGHRRLSLHWMIAGYLAFMVPSFVIYYLAPITGKGLPSIMCGFAVSLALIITLRVIPNANLVLSRQSLSRFLPNP